MTNINITDVQSTPFFSPYVPDIRPYFYGPKNIVEIIDDFLSDNSNCKTDDFFKFRDLLLQYKNLLYYEQHSLTTNLVDELLELMESLFKNYDFEIFCRTKSFCKLCTKAYLFSKTSYLDIDSIQDLSGYRFVLYDDSINICYDVMNSIINFFVGDKKFTLLKAEPLLGTEGFCIETFSDVFLPTDEDIILPQYKYGVKDYIREPKSKTAYQSLHAVFLNPITLQRIEIQVRNGMMHKRAILDHKEYKESRYNDDLDFSAFINYSGICLNGFISKNDTEILQDTQGFIQSTILANEYRYSYY